VNHSPRVSGEETIAFEGLHISFDDRVLRPRPWTAEQSRWAASLLAELPAGPVLELCAGAGQIGLAAVAGSCRRLVCVDADPVACGYALRNARTAGLADRVEVREAPVTPALAPDELFVLVVADPPWVRRSETGGFPEDPLSAIDGGEDGLDVARECVEVIGAHLAPGGAALLQLGTAAQAQTLADQLRAAGLAAASLRSYDGGVLVLLRHRPRP
jgi:methylase of polypeptide subunit release factors